MNPSEFQFLNLPFEIQELVLWKCLEGWKATVEVHEKPGGKKSTTRLWSSVIYDALMLSLTCKQFHKIIQNIQKNPRLFSGEIDMIEANAEMSWLVGVFTSNSNNYYIVERGSHPYPLYRTQVFIKANPYDRTDPDWRAARIKYHADVRKWLTQNVRSIGLWADEMTSRVPWDTFPSLEHITIYWPSTYLEIKDVGLNLCEHSKEDLVAIAKQPRNLGSAWDLGSVITGLERMSKPGLSLSVVYEVPHMHAPKEWLELDAYREVYSKLGSATFYNLECTFNIQGENWTQVSVVCQEMSRYELQPQERNRFAELYIAKLAERHPG